MYKLKNDTRLTHEQKLMVQNYISDEVDMDSAYFMKASLGVIVFILSGLISIAAYTTNTIDIPVIIIIAIIFIFGLVLELSNVVDKKVRMRSLANMIFTCKSFKVNIDYKTMEADLLNCLSTEKMNPKAKYKYEDIDFLLDFVKETLSRNALFPKCTSKLYMFPKYMSKLYLILEDTNDSDETKKNIDDFILSRANILLKILFADCLKAKYKKRYEHEYNNPVLSAEHIICHKECMKYNINLDEGLFSRLAERPFEERLDIIRELGAFKDKYKLPGLKLEKM